MFDWKAKEIKMLTRYFFFLCVVFDLKAGKRRLKKIILKTIKIILKYINNGKIFCVSWSWSPLCGVERNNMGMKLIFRLVFGWMVVVVVFVVMRLS